MSSAPDESFECHRAHLHGIAYRMLGSVADADDVVQDAYLRWQASDPTAVQSTVAYLTTVVTRLCLDQLKSARVERTEYVGPWLPEPVPTRGDVDPAWISTAFMLVLERLGPVERAVFLLHQVFDTPFAEIAQMVGKREDSCRQIFRRAKQRVEKARPRFQPRPEDHRALLQGFLSACTAGDVTALEQLLAEDAVLYSDGGGKVAAARKPIEGAPAIAKFFTRLAAQAPPGTRLREAEVNGLPGGIIEIDDAVSSVVSLEVADGRICSVLVVRNPDKLARW